MELLESICSIYNRKKIVNIILLDEEETHNFFFIGKIHEPVRKILNSLNNSNKINKTDSNLLSKYYGKSIVNNLLSSNNNFIESYINDDDSILIIKKKILRYLSDPKSNRYINKLMKLKFYELHLNGSIHEP